MSYHLYAPKRYCLGQELAPFLAVLDGCQWVIEPVSRHFFINQDLFRRGIDLCVLATQRRKYRCCDLLVQSFFDFFVPMNISFNTAALLFPAISLIMLAYTNRFLALAALVRGLHAKYLEHNKSGVLHGQIKNLRYRLKLIKQMQAMGVLSFVACIVCMYCIYIEHVFLIELTFALSLLFFVVSLVISLIEIQVSNKALELELSDMEDGDGPSLVGYIKKKFDKRKKHAPKDGAN